MTCRELTDFIMDYLTGQLAEEVRTAFDHHLTLCPDCVNYLAAYKATVELTPRSFRTDDSDPEASSDIPEDLVKAILASRQ